MPKISPMLWFDTQAEEAVRFYVSVFPDSRVTHIVPYGEGMPGKAGSVITVGFELCGQPATALNGGPMFKFPKPSPSSSTARIRRRSIITGRR